MDKDEIKKYTSMDTVLSRYALHPDRAGFLRCPFHSEKTASMKIYSDSFYCFGCGAHGDIFDFVQKMEGVSFNEAFVSLGGTYPDRKQNKPVSRYERMHQIRDRKADALQRQYNEKTEFVKKRLELRDASFWLGVYARGMQMLEPMSDAWCYCAHHIEYQFYKTEMLLSDIWKGVMRFERGRT